MTECIDEAGEIRRHEENQEKIECAKNKLKSFRKIDRALKEVLFLHDGDIVYRGVVSDPPYRSSTITVDGVEFRGLDAVEVMEEK